MVASPLAKGLFQRAIVESGGGRSTEGAAPSIAAAEATGLAFAKAQGIEGRDAAALAKLRALPAAAVTGNLNMFTSNANAAIYSGPVTDGKLVVESPQAAYLGRRQAKVAIMVGANGADLGFDTSANMDALMAPFGADKAKAIAAYDPDGAGPFARVRAKVGMDRLMIEPPRFDAATFAAQGLPAYEFRFDYVGDALKARSPNGAPHASEIPYVFDKYGPGYIAMVTPTRSGEASERDKAVARTIHAYWLNFAKTGDPNGAGLPHWPRYSAEKDELMLFDRDGAAKAVADPLKARLDLTAATQK
jgi:para-nitrobenzyl esterase